jgi:hypothetical protein
VPQAANSMLATITRLNTTKNIRRFITTPPWGFQLALV